MKPRFSSHSKCAFSAVELIVAIAIIVVLAAIILSFLSRTKTHGPELQCIRNLKSIGVAFDLYSNDSGAFPEFEPTNEAWDYFQTVGSEIGNPRILVCPADAARSVSAVNFEDNGSSNNFSHPGNRNLNLSYFYGAGSSPLLPNMFLAGDRNISTNDQMQSGVLSVGTNEPLFWTTNIHLTKGNLLLADGSALSRTREKLSEQAENSGSTNGLQRFVLP